MKRYITEPPFVGQQWLNSLNEVRTITKIEGDQITLSNCAKCTEAELINSIGTPQLRMQYDEVMADLDEG